ncbi:MAG: hypothetical protein ACYTGQ_19670 [Planctomycetota bacterium]
MIRLLTTFASFLLASLLIAGPVHAGDEPSAGAMGMPGAVGTFEFKPGDWMEGTTSWWKDSDGIAPGKAGCHIGTDACHIGTDA